MLMFPAELGDSQFRNIMLFSGYEFGASILRNLFKALTLTYCLNYTSVTGRLDLSPEDHIFVRDWAKPGKTSSKFNIDG